MNNLSSLELDAQANNPPLAPQEPPPSAGLLGPAPPCQEPVAIGDPRSPMRNTLLATGAERPAFLRIDDPCGLAGLWQHADDGGETLESRHVQELLADPEALRF